MDYQEQYQNYLAQAMAALETACGRFLPEESEVCRAARYSLMGGGKRIRAVLVLSVCDMLGGSMQAAQQFAAAVEMLHCYSLIHDDLPCMDNDDLRRGKPSNHKVYGENYALLAGDGLLIKAFETALSSEAFRNVGMERAAYAAAVLARCAGEHGMVGGQCIDLATENRTVSLDELCEKDTGKTANLIMAACMMGCIAAGANETQINAAKEYALHIGLAFQIRDDILDVTGDAKELGKNIGVDAQNARCTYVSILGVEKAQALVDEHTEKTLHALDAFDADSTFLHEFAEKLATRSK